MPDYESMYFELAAKVAEAVELLAKAQRQGENGYAEPNLRLLSPQSPAQGKDKKTKP